MLGADITAFLAACPMAVLVLDAAGVILFANTQAHDLFCAQERLSDLLVADLLPEWPLGSKSLSSIVDRNGRRRLCDVKVVNWPSATGDVTAVLLELASEERPTGLAVREANLRLRHVIEMLPQAVCVFDAQDRYVLWNRKYSELYPDIAQHLRPGIPFEEILEISLAGNDMRELVNDKEAWLRERMRKFRQPVSQDEQRLRDGRWLRHDDRRTPDGGAIGMRIDITDLKQREDWLRQLFDANPMPMLLCDGDTLAILQANDAALAFYGYEKAVLLSKHAADMHVGEDARQFAEAVHGLNSDCEARTIWLQRTAAGVERHVMIYVRLLHEDLERRLLLTIADVSERILAEAEANRLAHHDVLTGLPNRMQFYKSLDRALAPGAGESVAVCCLDLDGFKPVNDTFGHAAGDDVLKMVAERLRAEASGHMVARLGGDEFAILVAGGEEDAVDVAARCVKAFEPPFMVKGLAIRIGVSIGIAATQAEDRSGEWLIQEADRALYRAKADGRGTWRIADGPQGAERLKA